MANIFLQSWFWPAVIVVVGMPVVLVILTEVNASLNRRRNPWAKIVLIIRNFVVPAVALLILIGQLGSVEIEVTAGRVVATVLGFVVILLVLSAVNVVLFANPSQGTWRSRMPSIFVSLGRLVLIVVGLAILFSWVWNADVGGLFAALGVTSIVIGLALQNSVGSIISGLLLLFEQPFTLGDWLEIGAIRGRVVEVNWRAVHVDTAAGLQIVPNAMLAGMTFVNVSRIQSDFRTSVELSFSADDSPELIRSTVLNKAADLPELVDNARAELYPLGGGKYKLSLPLSSPSVESQSKATIVNWLWYAAKRAGLRLDGANAERYSDAQLAAALSQVAPGLKVKSADISEVLTGCWLETYGAYEVVQHSDEIPENLMVVLSGQLISRVHVEGSGEVTVSLQEPGDYYGLTALTRQPVIAGARAVTETTVLCIPADVLDSLVRSRPALAREIGEAIDQRRAAARKALAGSL